MFRNFIAAAGLAVLAATANAGEIADSFDGVVADVSRFMAKEVPNVQQQILERGPFLDCGCPHLCAMLGRVMRGNMSGAEAEQGLIIAMHEDLSEGVVAGLRNGGKFDAEMMNPARIKTQFRDDMDVERLADLVGLAAKTVLK